MITGLSVNGFSVSINERDIGGSIFVDALQALMVNHSRCPTHLLREVCHMYVTIIITIPVILLFNNF